MTTIMITKPYLVSRLIAGAHILVDESIPYPHPGTYTLVDGDERYDLAKHANLVGALRLDGYIETRSALGGMAGDWYMPDRIKDALKTIRKEQTA